MARKPSRKTLATKAAEMLRLKEQAGEIYRKCETILNELSANMEAGDELPLGDGVVFRLVDPFLKDGNPAKHWRHVPVTRWDYEMVTPKTSRG